ncbi:MAG TPA: hypothetical protein VGM75_01695 [Pseudonocardiaceae bacterium]|jgi:hypothetical protein
MLEPANGAMVQQAALVEQRDRMAVTTGTANQAAQMDGSAGNLLKAAGGGGGGGFKLDPHAAASLAAACQDAIDHIRTMQDDLMAIQQAPNLGTLNGAQAVATYTQHVATDPQGMLQGMQSLNATLKQMHDAYIQASTNYQETNNQVADILKKIDPGASTPTSTPAANAPSVSANPNSGPHFS